MVPARLPNTVCALIEGTNKAVPKDSKNVASAHISLRFLELSYLASQKNIVRLRSSPFSSTLAVWIPNASVIISVSNRLAECPQREFLMQVACEEKSRVVYQLINV